MTDKDAAADDLARIRAAMRDLNQFEKILFIDNALVSIADSLERLNRAVFDKEETNR